MEEFVFTTSSKSDYEWMLRKLSEKGIKYKSAKGDDWNCKFEIIYSWSEKLTLC